MKKEEIKKLRVEKLIERIKNPEKFGLIYSFEQISFSVSHNLWALICEAAKY